MISWIRSALRRVSPRRAKVLGALGFAFAALVLTPLAAIAFFTYTDSSNAQPAVAVANSLSAPTTPTATPSGTTITIGWTLPGSQLPGAQYKVTRTSGTGSPVTVCTVSTTSCSDAGLTSGTYGYSIVAVLNLWQSSAITTSATISTAVTVGQSTPGTYTLSVPAGVTSFGFTMNGAGGGGGTSGAVGAGGGTITGTITIPSSASATNFTVVVGGAGGGTSGAGGGSFGQGGVGCAAGGTGGSATGSSGGGGGGGATCIYFEGAPTGTIVAVGGGGGGGGGGAGGVGGGGGGITTNPGTSTGLDGGDGSGNNGGGRGATVTAGAASPFTITANTGGAGGSSSGGTPSCSLTGCNAGGNGGGAFLNGDGGGGGGGMASGGGGGRTLLVPGGGGGGGSAYAGGTTNASVAVTSAANGGGGAGGAAQTGGTGGSVSFTGSGLALFAPPTKLGFTVQPGGGANGSVWAAQPTVALQDAGGVTVPGSNAVTLGIASPTGNGAVLSCASNPLNAVAGVAAFTGCQIVGPSGTYTLNATASGLTSATSTSFTITVGAANKLAFTQQPSSSTGGAVFLTQPKVTVQDSGSNTVVTDSSSVTLSITAGTPSPGGPGTLTGCLGVESAGVFTFSGCKIDTAGTGYKLHAIDGGLAPADSTAFNITVGSAATLTFTTQPSTTATGGIAFVAQPKVTAKDAGNNLISGGSVTLAVTAGSGGGAGGVVSSCTANPATTDGSGVATFAACSINTSSPTPYTLTATSGSASVVSTGITVSTGPAAKLVFTQQPSNSTGGTVFGTQPKVTVADGGGNPITGDSSTATLSITAGTPSPGGPGTLTGCSGVESAGVFTFSGCKIDTTGTGYKLHAVDGALTAADSSTFNITVGAAIQLAFTQQPSTTATGSVAFPVQPKVAVQDAGGNTVTTDSSTVTLSITAGTPTSGGPGALTGCSGTNTAGLVTFSGCSISTSGTGYKLHAVDGSLAATDSTAISISATVTGLSPTSGNVGTSASITANGFSASHLLTVSVGGTSAAITSGATTAANGSSTVTFTIPTIPAGPAVVAVSDGTITANSATNFTVTASATGLSPTQGTVGTTGVTITARGFNASATLTVKVGGVTASITSGSTTAANGSSTVVFTIPAVGAGAQSVVVSDGTNSATSGTNFTVDTTAPTLTITTSGSNVSLSGTTVYFKTGGTGSFTVTAADPETGISTSTFPAAPTGWTRTTGTNSATYTLAAANSSTSLPGFSATNNVAMTTNATVTITNDGTAPTGGVLNVNGTAASAGGTTSTSLNGSYAIGTHTDYTEVLSGTQSGLASAGLTVASATLTNNTCGSFGTTTPIVGTPAQTVASGCYQYVLTGTDNVGNAVSVSTIVKVDTTGPVYTITTTGANVANNGAGTVFFKNGGAGTFTITASDPETGISGTPTFAAAPTGWTRALGTNSATYTLTTATVSSSLSSGFSATNNIGVVNSTLTVTITLDNSRPVPSAFAMNNKSGGTLGTIEAGDFLTLTYSDAESMSVASLCGWSGDNNSQGPASVTASIPNGSIDVITLSSPCLNIGQLSLGTSYVLGAYTFPGTQISWNASTKTLTIVLGTPTGSGGLSSGIANATPVYTPTTSIADSVGNTMNATAFNGTSSRF